MCRRRARAASPKLGKWPNWPRQSDRARDGGVSYRYHPLVLRIEQIIASGELGKLERVEAAMCFPLPKFSDIRYNYSLGGGATMDAGCYAVHMARTFGGNPGSRFGAGETARRAGRPRHDR